ncbi:hypothetical protein B0H13DRAFT_1857138 [Mycena leptocephala]|nr:hypothetical protein B0H13DRAFT_1857138 [Mycena leptocephala]
MFSFRPEVRDSAGRFDLVRLATTPRQRWFSTLDAWPVAYTLTVPFRLHRADVQFSSYERDRHVVQAPRLRNICRRIPGHPPDLYVVNVLRKGFILSMDIKAAGIAQTVLSYGLHSYSKPGQMATAASFACDIVITVYLCYFLARNKNEMSRSNTMLNTLMVNTINRGMLTALSSGLTLGLFLGYRETFWFLLSLAPNSKLYMNSMFAMLNMRKHVQAKIDQGWENINLNDARSATNAPLEFVKSPDLLDTDPVDLPSCDSGGS